MLAQRKNNLVMELLVFQTNRAVKGFLTQDGKQRFQVCLKICEHQVLMRLVEIIMWGDFE